MKTYSALPWQVGDLRPYSIFTSSDKGPKKIGTTISKSDAAFIVHACNSHAPMIAAMQKALEEASNANAQLYDLACENNSENAVRDGKEASKLLIDLQRDLRQAIAVFK